ncbi:MAG: GC-type dockerin domain-anchored protein [Phycisphaerales bacterium]
MTNDGSGAYLDIDTEPFGGPGSDGGPAIGSINDTELGLYDNDGAFKVTDDDDGSDYHTQLTFGDSGSPRAAFPGSPNVGLAANGRDGALTAGTYYLAVGCFNSTFNTFFDAFSTSAAAGTIQVNFRTNIPGGGGATACSPADLGMAGGVLGQDRLLNNNDFIAFISLFFANDARADLGAAGGVPGSDGQWNNNDFIAFISYFFNDSAHCNG